MPGLIQPHPNSVAEVETYAAHRKSQKQLPLPGSPGPNFSLMTTNRTPPLGKNLPGVASRLDRVTLLPSRLAIINPKLGWLPTKHDQSFAVPKWYPTAFEGSQTPTTSPTQVCLWDSRNLSGPEVKLEAATAMVGHRILVAWK